MPEYLSPGVYVEEVDTGTKPIEGVSTSTAGFVGVTQRGPVEGLPVLVTSFTEFRRRFGGYLPEAPWGDSRFLAYAVRGFFENGGQRAYIRRVVDATGAKRSEFNVPDGIVTRLQADAAGGSTKIRLQSLRGVTKGTSLAFKETVGGAVVTETKNVKSFNSDTNEVTLTAGLANSYTREGASVTSRLPAGATLLVRARDHGAWGNDVSVRFEYTTPARSPMSSGVSKSIGATMSPPLTLATGPNAAALGTLGAGEAARIDVGDPVEFRNGANDRERRTVLTKNAPNPDDFTFAAVTKDYSGAGRSVRTLVPPRALTLVTGPDPMTNPKQAKLGAGEAGLLNVGDTVEFAAAGKRELRKITSITLGTDIVHWADAVEFNYTAAGSAARVATAVRAGDPWLLLPNVSGLAVGDELTLTGGGQTEKVKIDAAWDGVFNPVPLDAATPVANTYLEGVSVAHSALALRTGGNTVRVQSASIFYKGALVELDNNLDQHEFFTVTDIQGNDLVLGPGAAAKDYNIGNNVRLAEFKMVVHYVNEDEHIDQTETFDGLSMSPAAGDKFVVNAVNARSELVRVTDLAGPAVPFDSPATPDGSWQTLGSGNDGGVPPDDDFVGEDFGPGQRSGIQAFTDIDQVSIIAAPGKTSQVIQNALKIHCEELKDRFAVFDPPPALNIQQVQDFRNNYDTKYAALYYPWVTVRDPLVRDNRNVPPSGHVIGIYARTDAERGVHKAPANEVIRGIVDLEQIVNKREQDILNPSPVNINVLRDFRKSGRGLRVWGARCITSDTEWKYVNVRRLFIYLEESLDEGTQWVVFEPNDEPLWARVRQSVTNFLTRVWRDGALMGTTPEEAFFVRCDRTTMTQDDIDNGRLIMLVGVAPVKPAEFVIIRIGQFAGGSEVAEL